MTKPIVAALVVVALAGGYGLALSLRAPSSREAAADTPRPAPDEERPRRRPAAERPVVARATVTAEAADPPVGVTPAAAAAPEREVDPPTEGERLAYAQSVFDSQSFDGSWAPQAAQRLAAVAGETATPGVQAGRPECRSNLCKLEVSADGASGDAYVRTFLRASKWDGSVMIVRGDPDTRGARRLTLYFAAAGTVLPEPPVPEP